MRCCGLVYLQFVSATLATNLSLLDSDEGLFFSVYGTVILEFSLELLDVLQLTELCNKYCHENFYGVDQFVEVRYRLFHENF